MTFILLWMKNVKMKEDTIKINIPISSLLVAECPYNKHGSSVFIRDGLKVNTISVCKEGNVELITVELSGVIVHFKYKPPPEHFRLPALGQRKKPHIVIGDFDSHNKQRRRICGAMGGLKQPVTHTQRETTEIIQQCNMEDGIQPGSRLCIFNHFGYV